MDSFLTVILNLIIILGVGFQVLLCIYSVYIYYFGHNNKVFISGTSQTVASILTSNLQQYAANIHALPLLKGYYIFNNTGLLINSKYLHTTNALPLFSIGIAIQNKAFYHKQLNKLVLVMATLFYLTILFGVLGLPLISSVILFINLLTLLTVFNKVSWQLNNLKQAFEPYIFNLDSFNYAFNIFSDKAVAAVLIYPIIPLVLITNFLIPRR